MPDKPVKPLRLLPAPGTYVLGWLFILLSAALTVMALAAHSGLLILFSCCSAAFALLLLFLTGYPRVTATAEGLFLQQDRKHPTVGMKWDEFQCVYILRAGLTSECAGLLFAARPLTKQEQFTAAKACQQGTFRPPLVHGGHVWIGTKGIDPRLERLFPDTLRIMPETECATVNRLFTKLI